MTNGHILITTVSTLLQDVIMTNGAQPSRWAWRTHCCAYIGGISMTSLGKLGIFARAHTALGGARKSVSVLAVTAVAAAGLTAVAAAGPAGAAAAHAGRPHHAAPGSGPAGD